MSAEALPEQQHKTTSYGNRQRELARAILIGMVNETSLSFNRVAMTASRAMGIRDIIVYDELFAMQEESTTRFTPNIMSGLDAVAGTYPETEFEYQVKSKIVQPLAEHYAGIDDVTMNIPDDLRLRAPSYYE